MLACSLRITGQPHQVLNILQSLPAARTVETDLPDDDADRRGDVHSNDPSRCQIADKEVEGHAGRDAETEPAKQEASSKAPHESHPAHAVHDVGQFCDSHRLPEPAGPRNAVATGWARAVTSPRVPHEPYVKVSLRTARA